MKLELISHAMCPYVHRAAIVLREKAVPFERKTIDLDNKPEWFLAISPRGKVPVLLVDDAPLFESAAIVEFIDETHPPRLMPEDPFERARQRGWVEVANDLMAAQFKFFTATAAEEHAAASKNLDAMLAIFEGAIGKAIDTSRFGLLDVAAAPALSRIVLMGEKLGRNFLAGAPKVEAWAKSVAARPSVVETSIPDLAERYLQMMKKRGSHLLRA